MSDRNNERTFDIGRGRQCDLVLVDESVSRLHAQLKFFEDGTILLIDCHSTHGTFLLDSQDKRKKISQELISPLDRLCFGNCKLTIKEIIEAIKLKFPDFTSKTIKTPTAPSSTIPSFKKGSKLVRCACGAVKEQGKHCEVCQS